MRMRTCKNCGSKLDDKVNGLLCDDCYEREYLLLDLKKAKRGFKLMAETLIRRQEYDDEQLVSYTTLKNRKGRALRIAKILEKCCGKEGKCKDCPQRLLCVSMFDRLC